ncbi:transposase [Fodinibius salsisoli]|uniref:Transposase n=1 Tax=Fodinibius salsisoli TaxID=2820877 RepID=A0ABT3PTR2_9BACT|nr:transposase [Fodinibius salsisoli]MCW9709267.1 transposase [Fodinibius salsisoli]
MSNKQTRRSFSKEFKLDVIEQSEHCEKITELAADLGLRPALIYRWRAEFKADPQRSFPGNGVEQQTPQEKKIARLQRELAEVKTQRDILKKAMGIFANHPK